MFNLNYDPATGKITSYQEGTDNSQNDVPEGSETLCFAKPIAGMFDSNGTLLMSVDVAARKLVLLNPFEIPDPLPNPPNAA